MSTTAAAREGARQRNGQFGTQRRSEPDPAIAGLGVPEAPLPTWEDALAHAKMLRAQGVDVGIDERYRVIEISGTNGRLHDPADGTPARQGFYSDGKPKWISHYTDGWRRGSDDGTPAYQWFYPDGSPMTIEHWTNGKLVSAESFPPPTGEA